MHKFFLHVLLFTVSVLASRAQSTQVLPNRNMVFSKTPVTTNKPANATQSFKGDDFIYGRVFFSQTLKEALFLEKNSEGYVPMDVVVEDLTNRHSLYISLILEEEELEKNYFDFDILPDTSKILRNSREFDTGRFSYFLRDESLAHRNAVFKFTAGDAVGYIRVDFSFTNLQNVITRDRIAYEKTKQDFPGEETR